MSYKVYMLDALSPIEWSQAAWRIEGSAFSTDECEQKLIRAVLLEHLPRDGLIIDAGCGTAKWVIYLRRMGYRIMGIDISHAAGLIAKKDDPAVNLMVADARKTPLRTHSVDAVMSLGVVEHDEAGPVAGLREIHRILKPNGLLVLDVPFNNLARRLISNHLHRYATWKRRRADWKLAFSEYRFGMRELRQFLAGAGFEVVTACPDDYLPPRNMGFWVDYQNFIFDPFFPPKPEELFMLPGIKGKIAVALTRWLPWLVCGEVTVVARRVA